MATWRKVLAPRKGDLAGHINGVQGEIVAKVEGQYIWLDILGAPIGPFPLRNYLFQRMVEPCPECAQGKHDNCTEEVFFEDLSKQDWIECPCHASNHI